MTASDTARLRAIDLVRDYYAAFNAGDRPAMLALLREDVVHDLNQGDRETGHAAFAAFMQRMDAHYREQLHDVRVMASEDGARAAAEYVVHGEYLGTDDGLPEVRGQRYVLPGGAFFDIVHEADGSARIGRVSNHYNLRDWIAQVGG